MRQRYWNGYWRKVSIIAVCLLQLFLPVACINPQLIQKAQQEVPKRLAAARAAKQQERLAALPGRLAVQGIDGNLYLLNPDGTDRLALTEDADAGRQYAQPTWHPTGEQIVWAQMSLVGEAVRGALQTAQADGQLLASLEVPYPPFYIYWSPTGEHVAYLSRWVGEPAMALRIVEMSDGEQTVDTVARGSPFYFSWSPDGTQLLTHVGEDQLSLQPLEGDSTSLPAMPGLFPAPQWTSDGETLVYAVLEGDQQRLITADLEGNEQNEITKFDGRISFSVSEDNQQIAYVLTPPFSRMNALGELYVAELSGNAVQPISQEPVLAFFWSPDSTKLAYMQVEEVAGELGIRWRVWDGTQSTDYDFIIPSPVFLNSYLQFFDQYTRSMSIWSPDSRAFTYAGITLQGEAGIWVQMISSPSTGTPPTAYRTSEGVFSSWSPK